MTTIKLSDIKYDGSIYPRKKPSSSTIAEYADAMLAGAKFPPIVIEQDTNRLLDGYHRWKAHLKAKEQPTLDDATASIPDEMACEYHVVPEGITAKLYALSLSRKNGDRPTDSETEEAAQEQYRLHPGSSLKLIAQYTNTSEATVKKYIKPLIAKFEEDRRSVIMRLDQLGWTQEEIAAKLKEMWPDAKGTTHQSVANFLQEIENFRFLAKTDIAKGHAPAVIAQRYAIPEIIAWNIALEGMTDDDRLKQLDIKTQPYDVWSFAKCHELFGSKHPGRIPGEIVAHVLYFYTDPGAMVIDPMAGSGTTPDVCLAMGRKCYAYDIDGRHERPDLINHNIAKDGWHERIKKADLIFWDPPYFEKMDNTTIGEDGYIEGSISKLERDAYIEFFSSRLSEAHKLVKKGTRLAFLMSDWDDDTNKRDGIFIWDYANTITNAGWRLTRHIQVPLSTQQVHGDIVNKFRESRRLARLERYLLIAEA